MKKEELELFAREAAKGLKTEKALNDFSQMLAKVFVEVVLNVKLGEHLGYSKNEKSGSGNNRNGYTRKTLRTESGQIFIHQNSGKSPANKSAEELKRAV